MTKQLFLILCLLQLSFAGAQTLVTGYYTSSDGNYTVHIEQYGDEVTLTEPNKVNIYKSSGGSTYYHIEPKYAEYYIRVTGSDKYYTGKKSSNQEYLFSFSGENIQLASGTDDCPLYEKYSELLSTDPGNTQAWTFCAAAAISYCTYTKEGTASYVMPIITAMKSIMDEGASCPCEDVISRDLWNSVD